LADLQRTVYPHKWSPISCRSSAGQGKFAGQRPTFYQLCHATNCMLSSRPRLSSRLNWSKMMPPPGLQIQLRPPVTLSFDLLIPRLTAGCPCPVKDLCQVALKSVHSFSKYSVHKLVTKERTDGRTHRSTALRSGQARLTEA